MPSADFAAPDTNFAKVSGGRKQPLRSGGVRGVLHNKSPWLYLGLICGGHIGVGAAKMVFCREMREHLQGSGDSRLTVDEWAGMR